FFVGRGDQDAQVSQIVSGRTGDDRVMQPVEKCICVAALKRVARIEACSMGARKCIAVGNSASSGTVSVDAIRSGAKHCDVLTRDFLDAREHEGRISTANSL